MLYLPTPKNISFFWNFGSLLGLCLSIQLISGIILSMFYSNSKDLAFKSVMNYMILENPILSIFQSMHANGASLFFVCLFIHIGRGLYYQSFKLLETWLVGVILFFLTMMTAFLGYVLPWGQMSFWGATVITNLLATIPYLGNDLVIWLWGGFSVDNPTLSRFFIFHFLMPFVILLFSLIHLFFLHNTGSSNPLGLNSNLNKIIFSPYFIFKDILTILLLFLILSLLIIFAPFILGDSDNFIAANPLVTPVHIQPEWYFLFAYAILRSIPNKLGGTIALAFSIAILFFVPLIYFNNKYKSNNFYFLNKLLFWFLSMTVILLTWIGMSPMEFPFILIGQFLTIIYFSLFIFFNLFYKFWETLLN